MSPFVRIAAVRSGDSICAQSAFLILLGLLTLSFGGLSDNREAELDYQTTRSLARLNSGNLEGTPEAARLIADDNLLWQPSPGQFRSTRPLGGSIASIPLYWTGVLLATGLENLEARHAKSLPVEQSEYLAHLFVGWKNSLLAAITAWLVVLSARRIGVGRKHAWLSGLVFILCSFVWPQARSSSTEIQVAFFLFLAFHLLLRARERFERLRRPRRTDLAFIGISLGMTFLTRPEIWPAILILNIATVMAIFAGYRGLARHALFLRQTWRIGHWVDSLWMMLPLLFAIALTAVANQARSGSIFGVAGELFAVGSTRPLSDLALSLLAPGRGLLWLAPLVLIAPVGLAYGFRQGGRLWPVCVVLVSVPILWVSQAPLEETESWGFGPGRLLPAMPFLWLGVALALDRLSRKDWTRRWTHALCVFGLITNLSGVLTGSGTYQELMGNAFGADSVSASYRAPDSEFLYRKAHWSLGLAEPWASWRILRHRLAGQGEVFPIDTIFLADRSEWTSASEGLDPDRIIVNRSESPSVEPAKERHRGFRHVAWIDLRDRLQTPLYPGVLISLLLVAAGCIFAIRGLDRALP